MTRDGLLICLHDTTLERTTDVEQVPGLLLAYFRALPGPPATHFHVGGYKEESGRSVQHIWEVNVVADSAHNLKVTTADDFRLAEAFAGGLP